MIIFYYKKENINYLRAFMLEVKAQQIRYGYKCEEWTETYATGIFTGKMVKDDDVIIMYAYEYTPEIIYTHIADILFIDDEIKLTDNQKEILKRKATNIFDYDKEGRINKWNIGLQQKDSKE